MRVGGNKLATLLTVESACSSAVVKIFHGNYHLFIVRTMALFDNYSAQPPLAARLRLEIVQHCYGIMQEQLLSARIAACEILISVEPIPRT